MAASQHPLIVREVRAFQNQTRYAADPEGTVINLSISNEQQRHPVSLSPAVCQALRRHGAGTGAYRGYLVYVAGIG